jgi:phosphotransferase system HPr (HPr) family protein
VTPTLSLVAPVSGVLVPLDEVPDPVFAQRLVGDGIAIDPLGQQLIAPCDGRVVQVHRAGHALTLSASGIEILIHVGLDTVKLNGKGFSAHVKPGDEVRAGDRLMTFDADFIATHARSLISPMLVTSIDRVSAVRPRGGARKVTAGRDVVMDVDLRGEWAGGGGREEQTGAAVESKPIVIGNDTGLHARPAAVVAAAARRFTSDVRIVKDGREANARSVVSIMALEVGGGDSVTVVARGDDADAAVAAIAHTLASEIRETHGAAAAGGGHSALPRTEPWLAAPASPERDGRVLRGVSASPGVAVGQIYQLRHDDAVLQERASDPNHERRALEAAIASAHLQLEALQSRLATEADTERAAIFAAHQELLEDPEVLDSAAAQIRDGATAAYAWRQAYTSQAQRLLGLAAHGP